MIFDHHQHYLGSTKALLARTVLPLQYTAAWPAHVYLNLQQNITSYNFLRQDNKRLIDQNLLLQIQQQKLLALQLENTQLRALLKTSPHDQDQRILVAEVLAVDADPLSHEIMLNKGHRQGVYVGQPVLDENGIMGQVVQVSAATSRILLITDARSAIPVQNTRTGMRGLLVGTGSRNNLALINIPITADVRIADLLMSSGLDGKYPAGSPVGVVRSVQHKSQEQFAVITVEPKAQMNRSQLVVLIWPK